MSEKSKAKSRYNKELEILYIYHENIYIVNFITNTN